MSHTVLKTKHRAFALAKKEAIRITRHHFCFTLQHCMVIEHFDRDILTRSRDTSDFDRNSPTKRYKECSKGYPREIRTLLRRKACSRVAAAVSHKTEKKHLSEATTTTTNDVFSYSTLHGRLPETSCSCLVACFQQR